MESSILFVSDGLVHPSLAGRWWLWRALTALPGCRFRRARSLEVLPKLGAEKPDALVLFVHQQALSPAALESLEELVDRGRGLLAVHSASASFKDQPRYFDLLGGRFTEHGPVETFTVRPAATPADEKADETTDETTDEIFGDIPAFSVRDELYRHAYDPGNRVHFYTPLGDVREPVVWTRSAGRGRVCYCALGHVAGTLRHPSVQRILRRGLAWVCGRPAGRATDADEDGP